MGLFNRQGHSNSITAKTIVCPNCGASTTNVENCEYCGSFLVQFVDKDIDFDHDKYSRELVKDIYDHHIGEILDFQLASSHQPGINGTRTIFCKHLFSSDGARTYDNQTIAFVLDGKFLSQFSIGVERPFEEEEYKNNCQEQDDYFYKAGYRRTYHLPVMGVTSSDYVVAVLFINYSSNADVNSKRSQRSRDLVMHSQIQKQRFLRCDVAKLMTHKTFDLPDYFFDIFYLNLGKDTHGVTSILLQLAYNLDKYYDSLNKLDRLDAKVQTL